MLYLTRLTRLFLAGCGVLWILAMPGGARGQEVVNGEEPAPQAVEPAATQPDVTSAPTDEAPATQPESAVRMTRPNAFEIHYRNADLRGVLQQLSAQSRKNIIATKDVTGKVTADLYGVTFREALDAVLSSSGFAYEEEGNFIYVMTDKQMKERKLARRVLSVRTFQLAYVTANDAKQLIAPAMSTDGTVALTPISGAGITTSKTDAGGVSYASHDVLVVRDYEENLERVAKILQDVDVKPQQVLIEATILRATLTEDNALGVDFNTLAGVSFENLDSTTTGLTSVTPGETSASVAKQAAGTLRTDFNSAIGAGGMTLGFLSEKISIFIRALESVTDVTVLANPKLLVVNKQRGEVMIGNRDGYITTTFTETTASQTVQFLETGTRLVVRPFIARDGYIRMEIHPEDSSGSVQTVGQNALPSETTTEVTSNVMVRDGRTIVIGGLFRERTSNGRAQVPLVGNLPYLGTLFRRTQDNTSREEVIILITPHVIRQAADEATSEQIKDDVERFRIGQRKGLQWFGRERLAQGFMTKARQELSAGRRDKALWNVDMVLSLEPRMEEAIRFKERLTEKAYWADESQYSATKYILQQMIMQELGKPVERIIPPGKPREADKVEPEVRESFGIEPRIEDPFGAEKPVPLQDLIKEQGVVIDEKKGETPPTSQPAK